jgi:hypothetical protein
MFLMSLLFGWVSAAEVSVKKIEEVKDKPDFVAHEWGTFTSLSDSSGKLIPGLEVEEEKLPKFVYSHLGFGPFPKGILSGYAMKGIGTRVKNVTIKMETPVVYFYSKKKQPFKLYVGFNGGSISQWYPQRQGGEIIGTLQPTIDFANPTRGSIHWTGEILAPETDAKISSDPKLENHTWKAPRATDANLIKVGKEVEKYLFYRGLGNFNLPIKIQAYNENTLSIQNKGPEDVPYVFVYEKKDGKEAEIWWTGAIKKGKTMQVVKDPKKVRPFNKSSHGEFVQALVKAGLYEKEAKAMLETWKESYFKKPGLKVFWICPKNFTNRILPMSISPAPKELKRVLVARSEVLTPEFEAQLYLEWKTGQFKKYKKHRFANAFRHKASQMGQ